MQLLQVSTLALALSLSGTFAFGQAPGQANDTKPPGAAASPSVAAGSPNPKQQSFSSQPSSPAGPGAAGAPSVATSGGDKGAASRSGQASNSAKGPGAAAAPSVAHLTGSSDNANGPPK
jgi:hypothetical protein